MYTDVIIILSTDSTVTCRSRLCGYSNIKIQTDNHTIYTFLHNLFHSAYCILTGQLLVGIPSTSINNLPTRRHEFSWNKIALCAEDWHTILYILHYPWIGFEMVRITGLIGAVEQLIMFRYQHKWTDIEGVSETFECVRQVQPRSARVEGWLPFGRQLYPWLLIDAYDYPTMPLESIVCRAQLDVISLAIILMSIYTQGPFYSLRNIRQGFKQTSVKFARR